MSFASPKHVNRTILSVSLAGAFALAAAPARAQDAPPFVPAPAATTYVIPMPMSGPQRLTDWEPGEPIPPGYHPIKRMRKGLVIGGALTFGITYLITALGGAIAADAGGARTAVLLLPVFGPFAMVGKDVGATGSFLFTLNGLAQAAGITMLTVGLAKPKAQLVRDDVAKIEIEVAPVPMTFGAQGAGFGLVGRF